MTFVSVVVPTYNRKEDLKKCITALINQSYPEDKYEIIICNDSSTDETTEFLDHLKSKNKKIHHLLSKKNLGPAHARNLGIKEANGKIIAFTDDDCIPFPDWIEKAVQCFEKDRGLTGLQGKTIPEEKIDSKKKIFYYARTMKVTEQSLTPPTCNIFYAKKDLTDVGGFDEELMVAEDTDLATRLFEKKKKISFSDKVRVYHKVDYVPFFKYLLSMSVHQYYPLVIKKNPSLRKNLFFKIFGKKTHIYPIFSIFSIVSYLLANQFHIFIYLFYVNLFMFFLTFFYYRVAIDKKISAYPIRIAFFIRYFLLDFTGMFFLLKGSIRFRTLVL